MVVKELIGHMSIFSGIFGNFSDLFILWDMKMNESIDLGFYHLGWNNYNLNETESNEYSF